MYTDSVRKANLEYVRVNSRAQHTRVWVNSRVRHTRVCANSRVKHTRVHASACTLASVERASRVWDVASGRYRTCVYNYTSDLYNGVYITMPTKVYLNDKMQSVVLIYVRTYLT